MEVYFFPVSAPVYHTFLKTINNFFLRLYKKRINQILDIPHKMFISWYFYYSIHIIYGFFFTTNDLEWFSDLEKTIKVSWSCQSTFESTIHKIIASLIFDTMMKTRDEAFASICRRRVIPYYDPGTSLS